MDDLTPAERAWLHAVKQEVHYDPKWTNQQIAAALSAYLATLDDEEAAWHFERLLDKLRFANVKGRA